MAVSILDLQNSLDELCAWRKKELLAAHFLAENAQNEENKRYLCRAWVLLMYAHCDNFLKESAKLHIKFMKDNANAFYHPELIWLAVRGVQNITEGSTITTKLLQITNLWIKTICLMKCY